MNSDKRGDISEIQCLPRKWFERIKGTVLEEQVLVQDKVMSIQSRSGWDNDGDNDTLST